MRKQIWVWIVGGLLALGTAAYADKLPVFSATGPNAEGYGAADHYPVGGPASLSQLKYMVGDFSHFDRLFPATDVVAASRAWEFDYAGTPPEITYAHAGNRYKIEDYLTHLPITGLLIAKDNQILYEGYQYGRTDKDRLTSQSMAKSIVAMLVGVAISEHAIDSVNDAAAKYVPELKNTDYGKATIRDLLHMSSGINCEGSREDFENIDVKFLARACKQNAPSGTRFEYSAADSQTLGVILSNAAKMPLAEYLDKKIWQRIGTEAKATWTMNAANEQVAYCCFNAVLRDYARLGRLMAFDGAWNGKQLIPQQWLLEATTVKETDAQLVPGKSTPFFGYGYQVWLFPGDRRMFALLGANGQRIFVDPKSKLIMVQTAVTEKEVDLKADREMIGLWLSLVRQFGFV